MYSQYSQNIDAAFSRLSPELQKELAPVREMFVQTLGRCDASLVHRGDLTLEGNTKFVIGPHVTVTGLPEAETPPAASLDTTWVFCADLALIIKEDSNADAVSDRYPDCPVVMWGPGTTSPGATVDLYDCGMLVPSAPIEIDPQFIEHAWGLKGKDGLWYIVRSLPH